MVQFRTEKQQLNMSYITEQDKKKFREGDIVRIQRKAKDNAEGWGTVWAREMNRAVGKTGAVVKVSGVTGVQVRTAGEGTWYYPHFVLKRLRRGPKKVELKLNDHYTATVTHEGVQVGCQTFTFSTILRLAKLVARMQKAKKKK